MSALWLMVTKDKYELPLIVADSADELAKKAGVRTNTVHSCIVRAKKKGRSTIYKKVVLDDDPDDHEEGSEKED